MKVGLVVPGGVDRSGTHRVIPCLLWLLERISHHDVHVFAMRGDGRGGSYALRGATIHDVAGTGRRSLPTLRAVLGEHRRERFNVLHAFWATGPGLVAAMVGRVTGVPVLLHLPGGDLVALPEIGYGGRVRVRDRIRVRAALAGAARRTAPSTIVCRQAMELGYPAERLPLGVSRSEWVPQPPVPREPDTPARLIHVASLNRVKDQTTLLRAARRLADNGLDFTLDVVGGDTLNGAVQRLATELDLDGRTRFHGFVPQAALRPLVADAHLMLVSSRHEAGPVTAMEAALVGVPTVGTAVGLLRDWAPDAAITVPIGDAPALAGAARGLLRDDPRRCSMARAAQGRAVAEDADWSARRVLSLYEEMTR